MINISIVTPSYNHAAFIGETIDSVLGQFGTFRLEYIVVDGGSTDGTLDVLEKCGDRIHWSSAPDDGQVDAINQGLQRATGDVVGWINSDDLLLPGALQRVALAFEDPNCMWLHGDCRIIDRHGREIRKFVSAYKRHNSKNYSYGRLLQRNFISQMTTFWRRDLMTEVGLLNPDFPLAFDYDFWLRLGKLSPPRYIPEPLAAFRWYDESKSGSGYSRQFDENFEVSRQHGLQGPVRLTWKKWQHSLFRITYQLFSRFEYG